MNTFKKYFESFNTEIPYNPKRIVNKYDDTYMHYEQEFSVDNVNYFVKFEGLYVDNDKNEALLEVSFGRLNEQGERQNSTTHNDTKNPMKVFSIVLNFAKRFIEEHQPRYIVFYAEKQFSADWKTQHSDRYDLYMRFYNMALRVLNKTYRGIGKQFLKDISDDFEFPDDYYDAWGLTRRTRKIHKDVQL